MNSDIALLNEDEYVEWKINQPLIVKNKIVNMYDSNKLNKQYLRALFEILIRNFYDDYELNGVIKDDVPYSRNEDDYLSSTIFDSKGLITGDNYEIQYNFSNVGIYFKLNDTDAEDDDYNKFAEYICKELNKYHHQPSDNSLKYFFGSFINNNKICTDTLCEDLKEYLDIIGEKSLKNLSIGCSIVLINDAGINDDERGSNSYDIELDFHERVILKSPNLLNFLDAIYRIKSHKNDYWHELFCGVNIIDYSTPKTIYLGFEFDHGS